MKIKMISSSTKAFLGTLIILSISGQIVNGNDDISICKKSLETLKDNVKEWMETCVDKNGNDDNTTACKEVKQYNKEMMQMQTEMCFYKDVYPKPYLIIMSFDKIYSVDSITGDIHVSTINGSKTKFLRKMFLFMILQLTGLVVVSFTLTPQTLSTKFI
ncbi:uncharacterized protein LOC124433976 [Xenia sp. Carnegie-2017]|uniref:uncharacterized protein LOC124433976 n=1 Tax=Xenia sp. Carnegie-2017 TaxID=2897299 RepID=UPI001F03A828|nr:uncharacterized protein LOC124433976 [Xenia sp. Carnegie-2017]